MGVAWQAGPARAVVFPSSDPPYDPSVASKVARHHLHPTSTESCMAEIMEPPTSQPAHQNEHKAVRSSGKNTRPVAEGPRPPKPHSPDRPRRRRRRFSSSLQGRPAYPTPTLHHYRVGHTQPTLHLPCTYLRPPCPANWFLQKTTTHSAYSSPLHCSILLPRLPPSTNTAQVDTLSLPCTYPAPLPYTTTG